MAGNMHQVTRESVYLLTALIEETKEQVSRVEDTLRSLASPRAGRFLFLGPRRRSTAHSAFARAKVVDNRVGL